MQNGVSKRAAGSSNSVQRVPLEIKLKVYFKSLSTVTVWILNATYSWIKRKNNIPCALENSIFFCEFAQNVLQSCAK